MRDAPVGPQRTYIRNIPLKFDDRDKDTVITQEQLDFGRELIGYRVSSDGISNLRRLSRSASGVRPHGRLSGCGCLRAKGSIRIASHQ